MCRTVQTQSTVINDTLIILLLGKVALTYGIFILNNHVILLGKSQPKLMNTSVTFLAGLKIT